MLQIYFGDVPADVAGLDDVVYNVPLFFREAFTPVWLEDTLVTRMVEALQPASAQHASLAGDTQPPFSAHTFPASLQALILAHMVPEKIFDLSSCDDNCTWWILEIAAKRELSHHDDLTICLHTLPHFGGGTYSVRVLNTRAVVHNDRDLLREAASGLRTR